MAAPRRIAGASLMNSSMAAISGDPLLSVSLSLMRVLVKIASTLSFWLAVSPSTRSNFLLELMPFSADSRHAAPALGHEGGDPLMIRLGVVQLEDQGGFL